VCFLCSCLLAGCQAPPTLEGTTFNCNNKQRTCQGTCNEGWRIVAADRPPTVTCSFTGKWGGVTNRCIKIVDKAQVSPQG
jgi:hypothetical protein